jgi:hypothetical protein
MMNSDVIDTAAAQFAQRLKKEAGDDLKKAVELAYRIALCRAPTAAESDYSLEYLGGDPSRLKGLAWLLFNLDEFLHVR